MATTLMECSLAQLYKRKDASGQFYGGPSFYIEHGLKKRWLGVLMATLLIVTFGFSNGLQSHAVTHSLRMPLASTPPIQALSWRWCWAWFS